MPVQVDTSPQSLPTLRESGRKILRTSNGTLWVIVPQASDSIPRLRYSTDDGANWSTSSTAFSEAIDVRYAAWTFCSDGSIYILYQVADSSAIKVRKGTLNGAHTDITSWSAATTVNTASNQHSFDLAVHEEGGSTYVHVVYATTGTLCEYRRAVWGSAFGSATTLSTWSGSTTPRIEFHHTQADVTAVLDSTPHVYVAWFEDGKVMFRKNVYSSGPTWTWNAARIITSDAAYVFGFSMLFDGTDVVMIVESAGTADALRVFERDAADTTTTSLGITPTRTGTAFPRMDITYNPDRDVEVFHADSGATVMQRVTYDRGGSSWGSWSTIGVDDDDVYPSAKLGYWSGSKGSSVELIWTDQSGANYPIMHERFAFITTEGKAGSDSATLTEIIQLAAATVGTDSATLTEIKQIVAKLIGIDAASLSETSLLDIITPSILDSAVLLLQAKNYSGSGAWLDESGNGHHAQFGSTGGEDTNDPQFLPWDGTQHIYLPGTSGNYVSTEDINLLDADLAHIVQSNPWGSMRTSIVDIGIQPSGWGAIEVTITDDSTSPRIQVSGLDLPGGSSGDIGAGFLITADSGNSGNATMACFVWADTDARVINFGGSVAPGETVFLSGVRTVGDAAGNIHQIWFQFIAANVDVGDKFIISQLIVQDEFEPDSFKPSLRIVGDTDDRAKIRLTDYTAGSAQAILDTLTSFKGSRLAITTGGEIEGRHGDGSADNTGVSVGAAFTNGIAYEIRATQDISSGLWKFYKDGANFDDDALGAAITPSAAANALAVGAAVGGGSLNVAGDVEWAERRDGIDGPVVARADFTEPTEPFDSWTGNVDGRTWTINRSGPGLYVVDQASFGLHTDDRFEIADHADLDFALADSFTIMIMARAIDWNNGVSQVFISKGNAINTQGYHLYAHDTSNILARIRDSNGQTTVDEVGVPSDLTRAVIAMVRNVGDDDVEAFVDGVGTGSPTTDTSTGTLATAYPLMLGSQEGGGAYLDGEIMAVVLWRSALTDADVVEAEAELYGLTEEKAGADSATLTEIKALVATLSKVDAATLTEVKQLVAKLVGVDAATLSEQAIIDIIWQLSDSAALSEAAIIDIFWQLSDSATLSESAVRDITFLTVSLDLRGSTYLYRTFPPQEAPKVARFGRKFLSRIPINASVKVYAERVDGVWEVTTHPGTRSPVAGVDWASTDGAVDNDVRVYNGGILIRLGTTEFQEVSDIADALTAAGYTVVTT